MPNVEVVIQSTFGIPYPIPPPRLYFVISVQPFIFAVLLQADLFIVRPELLPKAGQIELINV